MQISDIFRIMSNNINEISAVAGSLGLPIAQDILKDILMDGWEYAKSKLKKSSSSQINQDDYQRLYYSDKKFEKIINQMKTDLLKQANDRSTINNIDIGSVNDNAIGVIIGDLNGR